MKLTEDDLKKIFSPIDEIDELSSGQKDTLSQPVKLRKSKPNQDEISRTKIRKEINAISDKTRKRRVNNVVIDNFLRFCTFVGFAGAIFFLVMNYQAYSKQLSWAYYSDYLNQRPPSMQSATPTPSAKSTATPHVESTQTVPLETPGDLPAFTTGDEKNRIKIDKIGVNAPIIWNVENDKILDSLKDGVVHYKTSSMPGSRGNVFLIGHSSNYSWIKSDYNTIFALLDKLVNGDRIEIFSTDGRIYTYEVVDKKIVKPKNVEILDSTQEEILSVMTCWPIGTSIDRLVIQAKLVSIAIN
jgi:LPXTG-site transpeptidase (sortase) family protein